MRSSLSTDFLGPEEEEDEEEDMIGTNERSKGKIKSKGIKKIEIKEMK